MGIHKVHWEDLRSYCQKLIEAQGVSREDAFIVADSLVDADLCGVESHGVSRMAIYLKRLETGVVSKRSQVNVEKEYPASMALDACNSMGMVTGVYTMKRCVEKAKENGCCFATVRNSNHYGMASYYVKLAADENMVGVTGTNAPPNIAPWGSSKPYLGTNPLAIGVPTTNDPMILDMAPSVVAMGKVILAAKLGKEIPLGWALTKDGKPTTDAAEGVKGSVVPIGGPKGYGLALFIEVLCGILSGAEFGPHLNNMWSDFENPQDLGQFFCAIDISKFIQVDRFKTRMEQMIAEIKALPKNDGVDELFVPGEIEHNRRRERRKNGIELSDIVYEELRELGEKSGVPFLI